jgi:hypothetical protein
MDLIDLAMGRKPFFLHKKRPGKTGLTSSIRDLE